MKINHLGYVTRDLDAALHSFHLLGYQDMYEAPRVHGPKNLRTMRVRLGDSIAEVMTVNDATKLSFIDGSLASSTEKLIMNHVCYDVGDIRKIFEELLATGEYTVYEDITTGVFQTNLIGYLHHDVMGYIEFFEWPREAGDET